MIACLRTVNKTFGGPHFSALSGVINEHQIPKGMMEKYFEADLTYFFYN